MELGISVIMFLGIGAVVMALFCLITRYFNKKLQRALEDQNQVYSMIEEIRGQNDEDADGEYGEFVQKRENGEKKKEKNGQKFQLQMTQVKEPLQGFGNDIYGMGKLKRRLQGQAAPINPETGRSLSSMKSFRPDKLDTKRSTRSRGTTEGKIGEEEEEDMGKSDAHRASTRKKREKKKKGKDDITYHKYVSRIVGYSEDGIFILEKNIISVKKTEQIQEKKTIKKSTIKESQSSFEDTLEAYGFDKGTHCACKFQTTLEIPHMKPNEQYPVASLKATQSKTEIQFVEFYQIKEEFEEG